MEQESRVSLDSVSSTEPEWSTNSGTLSNVSSNSLEVTSNSSPEPPSSPLVFSCNAGAAQELIPNHRQEHVQVSTIVFECTPSALQILLRNESPLSEDIDSDDDIPLAELRIKLLRERNANGHSIINGT